MPSPEGKSNPGKDAPNGKAPGEDTSSGSLSSRDVSREDVSSGEKASGGSDPDGGGIGENGPGNRSGENDGESGSSSADAPAVQCVNCGHRYMGNYCPRCGQEADPSVSVIGVIGGFFREFIDLENGLLPTMVGLTVRPGEVLRRYLSGARAGLIGPGRYLLAAAVVDYGANWLLTWIGVTKPLARSDFSSSGTGEGIGKVLEATFEQVGALSMQSEALAFSALLRAGLLSALLYRLFESKFDQVGKALAVGSYLAAHAAFLALGAELLYLPPTALQAGEPVEAGLFTDLFIFVGYVGFASHEGFGPGWRPVLRGTFAATWAVVELLSVVFATTMAYATGLMLTRPDRYVPAGETSLAVAVVLSVMALIGAIPLLLHAAVELYYRLR